MVAELLFTLGTVVCTGALCALLARAARLPSIVAYLIAGVLLGPTLGLVKESSAIAALSEMGVALLLFLVGLELSLEKIRAVGWVAVAAGLGQVVFTLAGALGIGWWWGLAPVEALFVAAAMTFSSTVVAVKLLSDKGELNHWYGRIAVANSLVQTLVVLLALVLIQSLADAGRLELIPVVLSLGWALAKIGLLVGGAVLFSKLVLPRILSRITGASEAVFIASLCWCFAVVAAAAALKISLEVGALLAGLNFSQLRQCQGLQHRLKPLMNLFVAIFFVTLGAQIDVREALKNWELGLLLSTFVLLGNVFIFMVIIPRFGFSERTSFLAGLTGAQISEFSFIFVSMGLMAGLVGAPVVSLVAFVGLVTISLSAYFIFFGDRVYGWVRQRGWLRIFRARSGADRDSEEGSGARRHHIVIVGMNSLGRFLARALHERGESVLAVDTDSGKMRGLPCSTLVGSTEYLDVLLEAELPQAQLLVSALRIEEANELLAFRARQFGVPCCVHAVDLSVVDNLLDLGVAYLMLSRVDGVKLQNQYLREVGLLSS